MCVCVCVCVCVWVGGWGRMEKDLAKSTARIEN